MIRVRRSLNGEPQRL